MILDLGDCCVPEPVVCLQDVHDGPGGGGEDLVQSQHAGEAAHLVVGGDAGVLDAQVLDRDAKVKPLIEVMLASDALKAD